MPRAQRRVPKESTGAGTRWFIRHNETQIVVGTIVVPLLAALGLLPAIGFFLEPSFVLFVFLAADIWLWIVAARAIYLFRRRSQYELFVGPDEIRWGWSHDPARQKHFNTADLRDIEYCRSDDPELTSSLDFILADGTSIRLDRSLSDRLAYAESILDHFRAEFPLISIRDRSLD